MDKHQLARIILSGLNDIEEWRLGDAALAAAKGYPREYPADPIDDCGIIFADLTVDAATGALVCHEVNGPNAVGSDALTGDSFLRAENEAQQAIRRAREFGYLRADGTFKEPVATVHAHQHWAFFRTGGEFYPRVDHFADILAQRLPGNAVRCHGAGGRLGDEQVAVAMGDVPAVARHITLDRQAGRFLYQGRPLIFMGNPNLLPELIRVGKLEAGDLGPASPHMRILHAWRLTGTFHDKVLQQRLFANSAIKPLGCFTADSREEAVRNTLTMLDDGPVVLKPSQTSGGTGVTVVVPAMTEADIEARIDQLLAECRGKYGEDFDVFPIQGFAFVRSTGYPMEDGEHLWDLRIAVQFEPGRAKAFPVSLRFAPKPFETKAFHLDRDQWVSNVSGRQGTLLKSGMDAAVLEQVGLTSARLDEAMEACVRWTLRAWDRSTRGGGEDGAIYEDRRENAEASFYDWAKFEL